MNEIGKKAYELSVKYNLGEEQNLIESERGKLMNLLNEEMRTKQNTMKKIQ